MITYEKSGAVARVALNRPAARNALDGNMLDAIAQHITVADRDQEVRSIVLTGEGPVFCAGGDLRAIFTGATPDSVRRFLNDRMRPALRSIMQSDKPIIAALNGPVAGAGVSLALACDFIIGADNADFIPAFGKIGAMPDSAAIYLLVQYLGVAAARDIIFRSRQLKAGEALQKGLYSHVVPQVELHAQAMALAESLAQEPTLAIALAKRALRDAPRQPFDAFMDAESLAMAFLHTTQDLAEGFDAFKSKRAPVFRGC
ncbi:MAG TPA: enoyl-CoA hydratase-related protein [Noviherbaspirillum sp.]|nr:enoyl-CoA hydratase-related protein [Noviherbaspirillum sp.]